MLYINWFAKSFLCIQGIKILLEKIYYVRIWEQGTCKDERTRLPCYGDKGGKKDNALLAE